MNILNGRYVMAVFFGGMFGVYLAVFCYCAVAYLIGWMCMKTLVPKYKPVVLD